VNVVRSLPITLLLAQSETGTPDFVRDHFPALAQTSVMGVAALAMIAALAGAVAIGVALSRLFHRLSRPLSKRSGSTWFVPLSRSVQNPIAGLVAVGALDWAVHLIDLPTTSA